MRLRAGNLDQRSPLERARCGFLIRGPVLVADTEALPFTVEEERQG